MTVDEFMALAHAIRDDRAYEYPLLVLHRSELDEETGRCSLVIAPIAVACMVDHGAAPRGEQEPYRRPTISLSGTDAAALRDVTIAVIRMAGPYIEACDVIAVMQHAVRSVRLHHGVTLCLLDVDNEPINIALDNTDNLSLGRFLLAASIPADGADTEIRLYNQATGELIAGNDVARVADLVDGKVAPPPAEPDQ
jgi:hypothetical protein